MSDKVALVTGSTSGIGEAIAHALAEKGCSIIVHGLGEQDVIDKVTEEIKSKHKVKVDFVAGDLSQTDGVTALIEGVNDLYPDGIDILINNAGFCPVMPIEMLPKQTWDDLVAVGLTAPFMLIQSFLPAMKKKGWGRIINNSSTLGLVGVAGLSTYTTVKHGQIGLMKSIALETAETGVTVNCVCPTGVKTAMIDGCADSLSMVRGITRDEAIGVMQQGAPTKQFTTTEQVAEMVSFMCFSKASTNMTGATYLIDGGWTAQ